MKMRVISGIFVGIVRDGKEVWLDLCDLTQTEVARFIETREDDFEEGLAYAMVLVTWITDRAVLPEPDADSSKAYRMAYGLTTLNPERIIIEAQALGKSPWEYVLLLAGIIHQMVNIVPDFATIEDIVPPDTSRIIKISNN